MTLSNTTTRFLSAGVLIVIVSAALISGTKATLGLVILVGLLVVDELAYNFFKIKRWSHNYIISQLVYIIPIIFLTSDPSHRGLFSTVNNASVLFNIFLLVYLFYVDMEGTFFEKISKKYFFLSGLFVVLPLSSLASLFHLEHWRSYLIILLLVNFSMDTGAWFFGKNFGKNKLWKAVSPNKTVEGVIGGVFTSGIVGGISWQFIFGEMNIQLFAFFAFLGLMSQVGDLIQSKLKRQANIKDSSSLIPGHGGVYDRIDSLLFLAPFYAKALNYF